MSTIQCLQTTCTQSGTLTQSAAHARAGTTLLKLSVFQQCSYYNADAGDDDDDDDADDDDDHEDGVDDGDDDDD